jgi:hypothetical protein
MALTYDATSVLAQAAQQAFTVLDLTPRNSSLSPGSRAVTSCSALLELPSLNWAQAAAGIVDFTKDDHDLAESHHPSDASTQRFDRRIPRRRVTNRIRIWRELPDHKPDRNCAASRARPGTTEEPAGQHPRNRTSASHGVMTCQQPSVI